MVFLFYLIFFLACQLCRTERIKKEEKERRGNREGIKREEKERRDIGRMKQTVKMIEPNLIVLKTSKGLEETRTGNIGSGIIVPLKI